LVRGGGRGDWDRFRDGGAMVGAWSLTSSSTSIAMVELRQEGEEKKAIVVGSRVL